MARVALVTGGTRGIGAEIGRALQKAGRTVVATYVGNDQAARAFSQETGIKIYKFDVSNFDECKEAVKKITAEVGPIEILVNNGGITRDGTLQKMDREMWDVVIDTNLGSCYNMCRLIFPDMRERRNSAALSTWAV
jgi:acetoacetyl-CoA reductase